ncbi:MAG: hypothetical protein IPJ08_14585 [Burkholderiales bacterium]|nr:hypothetical protein [Burkholderiales bacterium]
MARSSRDRISVDLQGLKAALLERAQEAGASPSDLVRAAVEQALGQSVTQLASRQKHALSPGEPQKARLSLRLRREDVAAIFSAARTARLSPSAYLVGLTHGVPVLTGGATRTEVLATLTAFTAELSSLSRNLHHLCSLLRSGEYRAAQEYHVMLDTLAADVGGHLTLAARALADLRPPRVSARAPTSLSS